MPTRTPDDREPTADDVWGFVAFWLPWVVLGVTVAMVVLRGERHER
jgi:hypothetical protein